MKKRKLLATALSFTMAFGLLSGCGDKASDADPGNVTGTENKESTQGEAASGSEDVYTQWICIYPFLPKCLKEWTGCLKR